MLCKILIIFFSPNISYGHPANKYRRIKNTEMYGQKRVADMTRAKKKNREKNDIKLTECIVDGRAN